MSYNEDNIRTLKPMEGIRMRPAMYIDEIGKHGCYKLDMELIQNAIDEYNAGRCSEITVSYNSSTGEFSVADNGCGIPIGKIVEACTNVHSGGKFDNEAYKFHSGQNGVGLTVVNALSSLMIVDVYRDEMIDSRGTKVPAKHAVIKFSKGDLIDEIIEEQPEGSHRHGSKITFVADIDIMKETSRDKNKYVDIFEMFMYVNKGLSIEFIFDGERTVFYSDKGIEGYIESFVKKKKVKQLIDPLFISSHNDRMKFDLTFTYGFDNSGDSNVISFVNGNRTPENGSHVTGLKSGLGLALTNYIQQNPNLVPKSLKDFKISGPMISDNIVSIVILYHVDPMFNGQTKQRLNMQEVEQYVKSVSYEYFSGWLRKNPQPASKLVNLIVDYAKYEIERRKLKKEIIAPTTSKSMFSSNGINPEKFHDCRSNNPDECEVFITEGESAGGTVASARDDRYQAYYNLKGKIPNIVRNKGFSDELKDLSMIIGIGSGDKRNMNKLRFKKFIILTDADDDGGHIATLLIGFFHTYCPELIEQGMVYQAKPPIKQLISKNHSIYIQNDAEYEFYIEESAIRLFRLKSIVNNHVMSERFFRNYIRNLHGYCDLVDNIVNSLSLAPETLELICLNYNDIVHGRFNAFVNQGYTCKVSPYNDNVVEFDRGLIHESVTFNKQFYNNVYIPMMKKLSTNTFLSGGQSGLYLESISSGNKYYGPTYRIAKVLENIIGSNMTVKRFKGLGEMDADQLKETTIDPKTRKIVRVTMNDAEKAASAIKIFLGNEDSVVRKAAFMGEDVFT